jgi:hypothetical protein
VGCLGSQRRLVPEGPWAGTRAGRMAGTAKGESPLVPPTFLPSPMSCYAGAAHEDPRRAAALVETDRRYHRPNCADDDPSSLVRVHDEEGRIREPAQWTESTWTSARQLLGCAADGHVVAAQTHHL